MKKFSLVSRFPICCFILLFFFNFSHEITGQPARISSISNPSVVEGNSGTTTVTFVVTCDPCAAVNVIVDWRINDLTATTSDNDYVDVSGQLDDIGQGPGVETFNISVTVNGDTNFEPDETFQLELFNPSVGSPSFFLDVSTGTATIINDDGSNQAPDCSGAFISDKVANSSCQAIISSSDVTGLSDPDGDPLSVSVNPTILSLGSNIVTVSANDGNGGTCIQDISVLVSDNSDPVPDITSLPNAIDECMISLSSPNATDNCSGFVVATTGDPLVYNDQGTFIVTWNYNDGNGNESQQTQTVIVDDVTAPVPDVADLADLKGECSVSVISAPPATDNCEGLLIATTSDPLVYNDQGTFMVTWNYDDGHGNESQQTQTVIVDDVTAPVPDVADLVDLTGECGVSVISAPTATDNCEGLIIATTSDPLDYNDQGTFMVTWNYNDGNGNESQQIQTVVVDDITNPVIITINNAIELWPPNHSYQVIDIADCVTAVSDNCHLDLNISDVVISSVSSDEPEDVKGKGGGGDGNTVDDIIISDDCKNVSLRKERQGNGNGRVYTLHLSLDDGNGNTGTATCQVLVPKSKNGNPAIDDGAAAGYVETSSCNSGSIYTSEIRNNEINSPSFGAYKLLQNYPNPFQNQTTISVEIAVTENLNMLIYDLRGQIIQVLHSGILQAGVHKFSWNGLSNNGIQLESGIYLYKLESDHIAITRKLILIH